MAVSLDRLMDALNDYEFGMPQRILNVAAEIVAEKIEILGYIYTKEPSDAKALFKNMFKKITIRTPATISDVKTTSGKRYTYYKGDEESLNSMMEGVRTRGGTVKFGDKVMISREKIVTKTPSGFEMLDGRHSVSYVDCHIGGFTKFVRQGGNAVTPMVGSGYGPSKTWKDVNSGWVKGRDVIYSSVLLAKADILQEILDDIMSGI